MKTSTSASTNTGNDFMMCNSCELCVVKDGSGSLHLLSWCVSAMRSVWQRIVRILYTHLDVVCRLCALCGGGFCVLMWCCVSTMRYVWQRIVVILCKTDVWRRISCTYCDVMLYVGYVLCVVKDCKDFVLCVIKNCNDCVHLLWWCVSAVRSVTKDCEDSVHLPWCCVSAMRSVWRRFTVAAWVQDFISSSLCITCGLELLCLCE